MKIVLHELLTRDDKTIQLVVSFGAESARTFFAIYDGSDPKCKLCSVDEELFLQLSDLALARFGNCAVYQMELMGIVVAFATGDELPTLPLTLGATRFCTLKPGRLRILWNKLWIFLDHIRLYNHRVWVNPDYRASGGRCRRT